MALRLNSIRQRYLSNSKCSCRAVQR